MNLQLTSRLAVGTVRCPTHPDREMGLLCNGVARCPALDCDYRTPLTREQVLSAAEVCAETATYLLAAMRRCDEAEQAAAEAGGQQASGAA